jgi:hypothetical protein
MPPTAELKSLLDRTNRDFDDWSDFFEHSKYVWRGFKDWVGAGHTFNARNADTGNEFTEAILTGLSQFYITEHLASFTFQRYVSVFEAFVFGFLRILLIDSPGQLSDKDLKFGRIIAKPDLTAVIEEVVEHELNEIRYRKPKDWFDFLNRVQRLGCPSADEIEVIAETKATRDVLEHNAGIVGKVYVAKAGPKARFKEGEYVELSDRYLTDSWNLLKKVCNDLTAAAAKVLTAK